MQVGKRLITVVSLTWIALIAVTVTISDFSLLSIFVILGSMIGASALIVLAIHKWHFSKLNSLNQEIVSLTKNQAFDSRIDMDNEDISSKMADSINKLLDTIQTKQKKLERELTKKEEELKQEKVKFQQSIDRLAANQLTKSTEKPTPTQDTITGLPNQIQFLEMLARAISHVKRRKKILAILLIEIDDFDLISKKIGNNYTNLFIRETALKIKSLMRSEDVIAITENQRFVILLNDIVKPKFAAAVVKKILQSAQTAVHFEQEHITTTYSIAVSVFPNDAGSHEELLQTASKTLDEMKKSSQKALFRYHNDKLNQEANEYIQLESALREAIKNNELTLYYQPKLDVKRGIIIAAEALIRWTHPQMGVINANKLIPLAEECGLILPIGEWTLREACKTNKYWQDEGYTHLFVSVNLSPKQFQHPDLVNSIQLVLQETGLKPAYLELEINENTVMDDMEFATKRLSEIKSLGVQLSIDHFGSGQTSISHLKTLPISTIKIDRNFINGIPNNPNDMAIVTAFISLAHHLGLEVVAEGVETAEQVQFLGEQYCDLVQGYYVSHPQPADKIIQQFKKLSDEIHL